MFITSVRLILFDPQGGRTVLTMASVRGHTDVVQLLLSSRAQVDLQDTVVRHNINYSWTLVKAHMSLGHLG